MKSRREAREIALQCLYQCDTLEDWSDQSIELFMTSFLDLDSGDLSSNQEFFKSLVIGIRDNLDVIDHQISLASERWSISRMTRVDRNIIRISCYEIGFLNKIPTNVSINEAIEISKNYSAEDSPMFINGVLDNLAQSIATNGLSLVAQNNIKTVA
ncbi:MAG: transcription antitermination factor NusB [Bdellovibrionota bacterium]